MAERRYDEDEIREILARATELQPEAGAPDQRRLPSGGTPGTGQGLTLAELEEVGSQVGIVPARIAEAAAELELSRSLAPVAKPYLGVSLTAGHVVRLPRLLTEDEWDRFVVRLRDTFGATGTVRTEGSLQTWSNGHLKVLLEPLAEGARLRFQSLHGTSKGWLDGGLAMAVSGAILVATLAILLPIAGKPFPPGLLAMALGLGAGGAAMWSVGRSRAAAWLPTRENQFRLLGAEARRIAEASPGGAVRRPGDGDRETGDAV